MKINGTNFFTGEYAERIKAPDPYEISNETSLELPKEVELWLKTDPKLKKALNLQDNVKITISKEGLDLSSGKDGLKKIKSFTILNYEAHIREHKELAGDKYEKDPFWKNTVNQWLIFSETLSKENFYFDMSDEEVREFEDMLADITAEMDNLSEIKFNGIGVSFSKRKNQSYNFHMAKTDALTGLEASISALKYLSDKFFTGETKEKFDKLIDDYRTHNEDIMSDFIGFEEAGDRFRARMYNLGGPIYNEGYGYSVKLGNISKSKKDESDYTNAVSKIFSSSHNNKDMINKLKKLLVSYRTNEDENEGFKNYVLEQSEYMFKHISSMWNRLENFTLKK